MAKLKNSLPIVLGEKCSENSIEISLFIPSELDYFEGHFTDTPILAGVVQLHWAVELLKEKFKLSAAAVKDIEVLKFRVVIVPNQNLLLTLSKKSENKYLFNYQSDKGQHSSGRVVFEGFH